MTTASAHSDVWQLNVKPHESHVQKSMVRSDHIATSQRNDENVTPLQRAHAAGGGAVIGNDGAVHVRSRVTSAFSMAGFYPIGGPW